MANEEDGSEFLEDWLNETWPRISGLVAKVRVEKTRSGDWNDQLVTKVLAVPLLKDSPGAPSCGFWNRAEGSKLRASEIEFDSSLWDHSVTGESAELGEKSLLSGSELDHLIFGEGP